MKMILLKAETANEKWSELVAQLYTEKLNHFHKFEIKNLKSRKNSRDQADKKKSEDSQLILQELTSDDYVVLFDEKGKSFGSLAFSEQVQQILNSGKKRLVFIIGGAYGVSPELFSRAQLKVSLSAMTMNHIVAQVVILEQIYRSLTILNRIPYHNE